MGDLSDYVKVHGLVTKEIASSGAFHGKDAAKGAYPYAVSRNEGEIRRIGEQKFQVWESRLFEAAPHYNLLDIPRLKTVWSSQQAEAKRLFVSAYTGAYLDYIREEDAKKAPQPQPAATPAASTLQGATVRLTRVDHKTNEYVYSLELSDPGNFEGVEKTEWVVYFEGASVPDTEASSATAAYAIAGSEVVGYGVGASQKSAKKPKGSYLRKPQ